MKGDRCQQQASGQPYIAALTQENMNRHEASYSSPDAQNPVHGAVFMMGAGFTPSSHSRAKPCGIALVLVAVFCYFPGISMVVPIASVGFTNNTITGIIFLGLAVTLTIVSAILCLKNKKKSQKFKPGVKTRVPNPEETRPAPEAPNDDDGTAPLISSRDDVIMVDDVKKAGETNSTEDDTHSRVQQLLISESFVLTRYFECMHSPAGPFTLNQAQMDKLTEGALKDNGVPSRIVERERPKHLENTSSVDSAIEVDPPSFETPSVRDMV